MSELNKYIPRKAIFFIFIFFLHYSLTFAQGTLLVKKGYKTKARFIPGKNINMEVDSMKFTKISGKINEIGEDFIVVNGELIETKNIKIVKIIKGQLNYASWGANLMMGGILYPVIYLVNGIIDGSREYYSRGSILTGASLLLSGYLIYKLSYRKFDMDKKFYLRIIYIQ